MIMTKATQLSMVNFVKDVLRNAYYAFNKRRSQERSIASYGSFENYQRLEIKHLQSTSYFAVNVYVETPYETKRICSWVISRRFLSYLLAKYVFPMNDLIIVIDNAPKEHPHTDYSYIVD